MDSMPPHVIWPAFKFSRRPLSGAGASAPRGNRGKILPPQRISSVPKRPISNPLNLDLASRVLAFPLRLYCHHTSQIYLIVSTFWSRRHRSRDTRICDRSVKLKWQISTWMLLLGVGTRADKLFITSLGDTLSLQKSPQRTLVSRQRLRAKIPSPCCKP